MDGNTVVQGEYHMRRPGRHRRPVPFDVGNEYREGICKTCQPPKDLVTGQHRFHHHEAHEV